MQKLEYQNDHYEYPPEKASQSTTGAIMIGLGIGGVVSAIADTAGNAEKPKQGEHKRPTPIVQHGKEHVGGPQPVVPEGFKKVKIYQVCPGDTEWSIVTRAYPDVDPRENLGLINEQEAPSDRDDHILHPGQKIVLPEDAAIGKLSTIPAASAEQG